MCFSLCCRVWKGSGAPPGPVGRHRVQGRPDGAAGHQVQAGDPHPQEEDDPPGGRPGQRLGPVRLIPSVVATLNGSSVPRRFTLPSLHAPNFFPHTGRRGNAVLLPLGVGNAVVYCAVGSRAQAELVHQRQGVLLEQPVAAAVRRVQHGQRLAHVAGRLAVAVVVREQQNLGQLQRKRVAGHPVLRSQSGLDLGRFLRSGLESASGNHSQVLAFLKLFSLLAIFKTIEGPAGKFFATFALEEKTHFTAKREGAIFLLTNRFTRW